MQTLTKNGKLECPQDRQVYHAKKGQLIFPQSQYILKQLEKKPFEGEFQICNKHKKEKNLYCKERKCQTGICSVCLTAKHRRHAVVDFLTVKENIVNDVATEAEKLSKSLADQKEKLTNLREKMTTKYNQHIDQLNDGKTDFMASVQPKLDKIEDILQSLNIQKRANLKMKCRLVSHETGDKRVKDRRWFADEGSSDVFYIWGERNTRNDSFDKSSWHQNFSEEDFSSG